MGKKFPFVSCLTIVIIAVDVISDCIFFFSDWLGVPEEAAHAARPYQVIYGFMSIVGSLFFLGDLVLFGMAIRQYLAEEDKNDYSEKYTAYTRVFLFLWTLVLEDCLNLATKLYLLNHVDPEDVLCATGILSGVSFFSFGMSLVSTLWALLSSKVEKMYNNVQHVLTFFAFVQLAVFSYGGYLHSQNLCAESNS